MKKTKKNFKQTLDNWYNGIKYKNGFYGQVKRGYGSYLYTQDKVMFDMHFKTWQTTDTRQQFEAKV